MFTKNLTRDELKESIQNHLATTGRRMTNLHVAKLAKLQEIAQKYNLPITKEKEEQQNLSESYYQDTFKVGDLVVIVNRTYKDHYEFFKVVGFTPKKFIRGVRLPCEKSSTILKSQDVRYTYIPDISYDVQKQDKFEVIRNKNTCLFEHDRLYEYEHYFS